MQHNEDDILKAIFQKEFKNRHEIVEEENWDMIAANLEKKRFYKFSFSRFNIFYSALIIFSVVISLITITKWVSDDSSSSLELKPDSAQLSNQTDETKTKTTIPETSISASLHKNTITTPLSRGTKDSQQVPKNISSLPDSGSLITNTPAKSTIDTALSVLPKEKPKPVIRKIVYKIKQDTLIVVDTVRSSKKKKK